MPSQFGGYYVNAGNVPRVLRWVPSASLIKHGFEGLCATEFPGLAFEPAPGGAGRGDQTGEPARARAPAAGLQRVCGLGRSLAGLAWCVRGWPLGTVCVGWSPGGVRALRWGGARHGSLLTSTRRGLE